MRPEDLDHIRRWFSGYVASFRRPEHAGAVTLKIKHTRKVCENILVIAGERPSITDNALRLAEATALLHDVGRFPQYAQYGTFDDRASTNHGRLGAEVLQKKRAIENLPERERKLIIDAVRFHNALKLPALERDTLLHLRLLRDADKLDIWRVLLEAYEGEDKSSVATLGLADAPECSRQILSSIEKGRVGHISEVKTLNDLKLVHLSWVFDLNFATTYRLLNDRGYIQRIAASLPKTDDVQSVLSNIERFSMEKQKEH